MSAINELHADCVSSNTELPITFDALADLTGFPVEFIKKELLLNEESVSISELRSKVVDYIKRTSLLS